MLIKYCSFLARSEKTNQKRGATPKAPYIGGCNLLRAETALRKGFGMALQPLPFGFAIVFN